MPETAVIHLRRQDHRLVPIQRMISTRMTFIFQQNYRIHISGQILSIEMVSVYSAGTVLSVMLLI